MTMVLGSLAGKRTCDWPACRSQYSSDVPAISGWRAFGITTRKILLCPFHADGEHRPRLILLTPGPAPVRSECTCSWSGSINGASEQSIEEWKAHIAFVIENL